MPAFNGPSVKPGLGEGSNLASMGNNTSGVALAPGPRGREQVASGCQAAGALPKPSGGMGSLLGQAGPTAGDVQGTAVGGTGSPLGVMGAHGLGLLRSLWGPPGSGGLSLPMDCSGSWDANTNPGLASPDLSLRPRGGQ